jgi:MoxR-like ATPase
MEMNKVIVGQKHMVERLLIGLLAYFIRRCTWTKTLAINTLSQAIHGSLVEYNLRQIYFQRM